MNRIATLPPLVLELQGTPLPEAELQTLGGVRVQQRLSLPTLCELTFRDPSGPIIDVRPGAALRVAVRGQADDLFVGQVAAVEYLYEPSRGREVRVRGYDRLQGLRQRQTIRAHVDVTVADLLRQMVSDLGLAVEASEVGPRWQRLIHHHATDLDFVSDAAERCGLYFTVRDTILHLLTLEGIGETRLLTLGESLLEARVELNVHGACQEVSTFGWNTWRAERHTGTAQRARLGRTVGVEVQPTQVGGTGERKRLDVTVQNDLQAQAGAQAELDRRRLQEVMFCGVAEGDTSLRPGTPVRVVGLAPAVSGRYILTAVDHIIDTRRGFVSELSTSLPPPRERPRESVATLGIVTRINDPEKLGRIQASLPAYGDVDTDWMGVLSAGAGNGKGFVALADVGDTVLVLLVGGDPAQGIALGGLYGAHGPPDDGIEAQSVQRYVLLTPGKQRVTLDDSRKLLRIENSEGSFVELSPDTVKLHAATALEIEAPGQSIVIRGDKIDFQRG